MNLVLTHCRSAIDAAREVRDFLFAKKVKREPLRFRPRGVMRATFKPRDRSSFAGIRAALRDNRDRARASERLDALERELLKRRDVALPLPEEVIQHEDRSISWCFGGVTVRAFPDGIAYLLGGTAGHLERGVKPPLLEALALKARMQRQ
jgi:hypothetical protein